MYFLATGAFEARDAFITGPAMQDIHEQDLDTPAPSAEGPPCFRCEGTTEFHSRIVGTNDESVFFLYRCPTCENQLWAPPLKGSGY